MRIYVLMHDGEPIAWSKLPEPNFVAMVPEKQTDADMQNTLTGDHKEKVAKLAEVFECSMSEAKIRLDMLETGRRLGRDEGREDVQRWFRLALGIDAPTPVEATTWQAPFKLRESFPYKEGEKNEYRD